MILQAPSVNSATPMVAIVHVNLTWLDDNVTVAPPARMILDQKDVVPVTATASGLWTISVMLLLANANVDQTPMDENVTSAELGSGDFQTVRDVIVMDMQILVKQLQEFV